MLLGFNRGKLGEIVFKRQNGQSIQVPRVRSPKNPRTDAQTIQRVCFASASKMAQHLRGIVDHSFQGYKYGQVSVNHFVSYLTKELKEFVTSALASPSAAPYGTAPILPYIASGVAPGARALISSGDLRGIEFSLFRDEINHYYGMVIGNPQSAVTLGEAKLSDYQEIFGIPATDQVTILEAQPEELDYISETELFYGARFDWLRWNIKSDVAGTTALFVSGAQSPEYKLNPAVLDMERTDPRVVDIVFVDNANGMRICTGSSISDSGDVCGNGLATTVCLAGVIVSRYENGVWRRSTTRLIRSTKEVQATAAAWESTYAYNDIESTLALGVPQTNVREDEYLNKKKD